MTHPREIRPAAVAARLDGYRIVDVREPSEFDGPLGRLAGALNVPLGELETRADELAGRPALLVVCRSGNRSGRACQTLARQGIADATNLAGGMIEWRQERLPVVRDRLPDAAAVLETFVVWLAQVHRIPEPEASAFVRARLQGDASDPASVAAALAGADDALRAEGEPPADLGLVLETLRGDLAALGTGPGDA